jgi:hypothetical protein
MSLNKLLTTTVIATMGFGLPALAQTIPSGIAAIDCQVGQTPTYDAAGDLTGCFGDPVTVTEAAEAAVDAANAPTSVNAHRTGITAVGTWEGVAIASTSETIVLRSLGDGNFTPDNITLPTGWTFRTADVRMNGVRPGTPTNYVINLDVKDDLGTIREVLMVFVIDPAAPAGSRTVYKVDFDVF